MRRKQVYDEFKSFFCVYNPMLAIKLKDKTKLC